MPRVCSFAARRAFTLVELLIVVAAIALIGVIAFGRFTRASLQGDVALAQSRMATLSGALEAYKIDNGVYPACSIQAYSLRPLPGEPEVLERLSTPIAYIADSNVIDPFPKSFRKSAATALLQAGETPAPVGLGEFDVDNFLYQAWCDTGRSQTVASSFFDPFLPATAYILQSTGPDETFHVLGGILANDLSPDGPVLLLYDPTNGAVSQGSIFCTGGSASATPGYAAGAGLLAVAPSCASASPASVGESWSYY